MDIAIYKSINIPIVYYILALLLVLVTGFIDFYKKHNIEISIARALLMGYIFLIFSSTVIARTVKSDYDFKLGLFWSYAAIAKGKEYLLFLNIANVLMLMPIGFLVSYIGTMNYKKAALIGFGISSVIEFCQLILKRGMFEFDDIFHNTLGCVIGYLIYRLYRCVRERG